MQAPWVTRSQVQLRAVPLRQRPRNCWTMLSATNSYEEMLVACVPAGTCLRSLNMAAPVFEASSRKIRSRSSTWSRVAVILRAVLEGMSATLGHMPLQERGGIERMGIACWCVAFARRMDRRRASCDLVPLGRFRFRFLLCFRRKRWMRVLRMLACL